MSCASGVVGIPSCDGARRTYGALTERADEDAVVSPREVRLLLWPAATAARSTVAVSREGGLAWKGFAIGGVSTAGFAHAGRQATSSPPVPLPASSPLRPVGAGKV